MLYCKFDPHLQGANKYLRGSKKVYSLHCHPILRTFPIFDARHKNFGLRGSCFSPRGPLQNPPSLILVIPVLFWLLLRLISFQVSGYTVKVTLQDSGIIGHFFLFQRSLTCRLKCSTTSSEIKRRSSAPERCNFPSSLKKEAIYHIYGDLKSYISFLESLFIESRSISLFHRTRIWFEQSHRVYYYARSLS